MFYRTAESVSPKHPDKLCDLTLNDIIKFLDLKRPIYAKTAEYGHYGEGFDWDK